jgi:carbamoyl-phosphate synthase large subunit
VLPPINLSRSVVDSIREYTKAIAGQLKVVGLLNIQYAVKDEQVYVLEVNPRASRTVPFVSKATGVPLAKVATRLMVGESLEALGLVSDLTGGRTGPKHICCKESVFPFNRFPGVDTLLGPEMKSTGEVMGIDRSFGLAFAKAQIAAGQSLPLEGKVFISVKDRDKRAIADTAAILQSLGFEILATEGTARFLGYHEIAADRVFKVREGRPNIVDMIKNNEIRLVINTTGNKKAVSDSAAIRRAALENNVAYTTTVAGARATTLAIKALINGELQVRSLQESHDSY